MAMLFICCDIWFAGEKRWSLVQPGCLHLAMLSKARP